MNIRENVNEKIIVAFKKEIVPWDNNHGVHANFLYKEKYNGINPLLLNLAAKEIGFKSKWWVSRNQIKTLNPNEQGVKVVIYKKGIFGTRLCEDVLYNVDKVEMRGAPRYNDMEQIIRATKVKFKIVDEKVAYYYYPPKDWIQIPPKDAFLTGKYGLNGYYETIAHELMHWSEIKLGWPNDANKYPRAIRELRAEMGAAFLMTELDIPYIPSLLNYRMNVNEWIDCMRRNNTWIFRVAVSACKAVDYLLALINANTKRFNYVEEGVA